MKCERKMELDPLFYLKIYREYISVTVVRPSHDEQSSADTGLP